MVREIVRCERPRWRASFSYDRIPCCSAMASYCSANSIPVGRLFFRTLDSADSCRFCKGNVIVRFLLRLLHHFITRYGMTEGGLSGCLSRAVSPVA
jgi:hypothetical protein